MENYKSVPLKVITEELQITDAPIKALVKKGTTLRKVCGSVPKSV